MPQYLRRTSVRLLETSLECLHLAANSLGSTKRISFRDPTAKYAAEIGLIGASAELAMGACLIQAFGEEALLRQEGARFKTFGPILQDCRALIRDARPFSSFITAGVPDPTAHRQKLLRLVGQLRVLVPFRANGLHAGSGPVWEAAVVQANTVADFLSTLGESSKIHPYIEEVPRCTLHTQERHVIVEALARRMTTSQGREAEALLSSVYLVLPDVPDDPPEWLEALDRFTVSPQAEDAAYLIRVLERAVPMVLQRTGAAGAGLPVTVRPHDAHALPIQPQHLRTTFTNYRDQIHADIANANGRLTTGRLDLPPIESLQEVFALSLGGSGVLADGEILSAHQAWVLVAGGLHTQHTTGPVWHVIRRTDDLGQLIALLRNAAPLGYRKFRENIGACIGGIEAIRDGLNSPTALSAPFVEEMANAEANRDRVIPKIIERVDAEGRALPEEIAIPLRSAIENNEPLGTVINMVVVHDAVQKEYWCRILAEASTHHEDARALVAILSQQELRSTAHTAARKALRRIDFYRNGPPIGG